MPRQLIERSSIPFLGKEERAEQLIRWSNRRKRGDRWVKHFQHGLTLAFVADGSEPRMYIHWNQSRFQSFLQGLGCQPDHLFFTEYGVCVLYRAGRTVVTLPAVGGTKVVLWDSSKEFCQENSQEDVNWMTGLVKFTEQGFVFLSQVESQQELQEASAVAKLRVERKPTPTKTRQPAQMLPPAQLSDEARSYLFQDALTNLALQARKQQAKP